MSQIASFAEASTGGDEDVVAVLQLTRVWQRRVGRGLTNGRAIVGGIDKPALGSVDERQLALVVRVVLAGEDGELGGCRHIRSRTRNSSGS